MIKINLQDYYPFYQYDCFVDVPEEVAEALQEFDRQENAYQRCMYRNKAQYSLDQGDGIEHNILFVSLSPWEIYERKVTYEQLHAAIASLPISKVAIAKAEGVSEKAVRVAIERGLKQIEKVLKTFL